MKIAFHIALLAMFVSCQAQMNQYNLNKPSQQITLPEVLIEISGLKMVNDSTIACVQDEEGIVFIFDVYSNKIVREIEFKKSGDFEGIAKVGEWYYVLESDGTLYKVSVSGEKTKYDFPEKGNEFEGLCFDAKNNRLILACKEEKGKDKNIKLFAFDVLKNTFDDKAFFKMNKEEIHPNFKASGVAIHPNGDVYIVSSVAKTLLQLSAEFKIKAKSSLNPYIFHQPEGICFNTQGDMFISNELNGSAANILMFKYSNEK